MICAPQAVFGVRDVRFERFYKTIGMLIDLEFIIIFLS